MLRKSCLVSYFNSFNYSNSAAKLIKRIRNKVTILVKIVEYLFGEILINGWSLIVNQNKLFVTFNNHITLDIKVMQLSNVSVLF